MQRCLGAFTNHGSRLSRLELFVTVRVGARAWNVIDLRLYSLFSLGKARGRRVQHAHRRVVPRADRAVQQRLVRLEPAVFREGNRHLRPLPRRAGRASVILARSRCCFAFPSNGFPQETWSRYLGLWLQVVGSWPWGDVFSLLGASLGLGNQGASRPQFDR